MQLNLGSTRAPTCFDRRPRRSEEIVMQSPKSDPSECLALVGQGAHHRTRGRVRSPSNCMDPARIRLERRGQLRPAVDMFQQLIFGVPRRFHLAAAKQFFRLIPIER